MCYTVMIVMVYKGSDFQCLHMLMIIVLSVVTQLPELFVQELQHILKQSSSSQKYFFVIWPCFWIAVCLNSPQFSKHTNAHF